MLGNINIKDIINKIERNMMTRCYHPSYINVLTSKDCFDMTRPLYDIIRRKIMWDDEI